MNIFKVFAVMCALLLTAACSGSSSGGGEDQSNPPSADFTFAVDAINPLRVSFTDNSTQGSANITTYAWNFGNGSVSSLQNPVHTYITANTYEVTLTVTDENNNSDSVTKSVTVSPIIPPLAEFTFAADDLINPLKISFTNNSTQGSAPINSYSWNFGANNATGTDKDTSYSYSEAWVYTVTLTVTDENGEKSSISKDVWTGSWIDVSTAALLNSIRTNLNTNYRLTADINLAGYNSDNWLPIGANAVGNRFTGKFHGNGYKIRNMKIDRSGTSYIGLFGYIDNATLSNIAMEDVDIVGWFYVGGIAGGVDNSTITNSYSTGKVNSGNLIAGGIAGYLDNSTVTGNYSAGDVTVTTMYAGGIVGYMMNSTITNSYSTGDANATNSSGGIAGYMMNSTITNSYSTGEVNSGNVIAGGIAGYLDNSTVTGNYSAGKITANNSRAGGIAGEALNGNTITNNAAINSEIDTLNRAGRIVGEISGASNDVSNNFALSTMTATGVAFITIPEYHGISKTSTELRTQATYSAAPPTGLGWLFGADDLNPWKWVGTADNPYPILYWQ